MVQKVVIFDDLDGSEASVTIIYAVDGDEYEIDLSEKNAEKFRAALEDYINVSRKLEPQPPAPTSISRAGTRRRSSGSSGRHDIAEIRKWAEEKGIEVAPRGRIKKEIVDQYDAERTKSSE